ncbi:MAG: tRNA (guanosine(46)-N7)-methyltransferase TrmB [Lachnospiraceae bacterium]|nr:tRNA (guanosine(46)-N7)-methyltransferase TrmB [Lachnospiraceae bacterium]
MRLRNVKGAREAMVESELVFDEPKEWKGRWHAVFGNDHPIHIEIGMGKGRFIVEMAQTHPEINYIGIEKYSSVLIRALEKREGLELHNLYFIRMDAEEINEVFAEHEVDQIYLNFSDPWPKDRHAKRRLTSPQFLARYDQLLMPEGHLEFKTDNVGLFDFSLESVQEAGWELLYETRDLHHSPYMEGNVMTEYEAKFSGMGNPICKLAAMRHHSEGKEL